VEKVKNKNKANWQKHSDKRAGELYDINQNMNKGDKNKKYKKEKNPNKKNKKIEDKDNNE